MLSAETTAPLLLIFFAYNCQYCAFIVCLLKTRETVKRQSLSHTPQRCVFFKTCHAKAGSSGKRGPKLSNIRSPGLFTRRMRNAILISTNYSFPFRPAINLCSLLLRTEKFKHFDGRRSLFNKTDLAAEACDAQSFRNLIRKFEYKGSALEQRFSDKITNLGLWPSLGLPTKKQGQRHSKQHTFTAFQQSCRERSFEMQKAFAEHAKDYFDNIRVSSNIVCELHL